MRLTNQEVLDLIEVKDGVLIYRSVLPRMKLEVGDPVAVVSYNKKPHYQIRGVAYNPRRVIEALTKNDPELLRTYKTQSIRPLDARDMEIHAKLSAGQTYADIGAEYGVSRQRIKQIVDKLARAGHPVSALSVRQDSKRAQRAQAIAARYGDNYDAIAQDAELRRYLGRKLTIKRNNALQKGIQFALTISDLHPLPKTCPVLGIPLSYEGNEGAADNAMSIDRIDPNKGYVQGNIVLVSQRANRIKNDATPLELRKIADFYAQFDDNA
jgi:hypothetical protein